MAEPPSKTEVAVIGGGVIGLSIAFHLAENGVDVTLFERSALGGGASGSSAAMVRTYFPGDPTNSMLAMRSLSAYRGFTKRHDADPALQQVGFLVLFTEAAQLEAFKADVAAQHAVGVEVELIDAFHATEINPFLDPETFLAAAWAPLAFACAPGEIMRGYTDVAAWHGARICASTEVVTVDLRHGLVGTEYGETSADAVVCAAGPWSQAVAAMCGVHLPVSPRRTELLLSDALPTTQTIPHTLHAASGLRVRNVGNRLLVGMGRPATGEVRSRWVRRVADQFAKTYPTLAGIGLHHGWTGVWDGTADGTAFLGESAGPGRFLYAAGFSGHGFCQAPAVGEVVRDLYFRRRVDLDLGVFSRHRAAARPVAGCLAVS